MQINIQSRNFILTSAIEAHIHRRLSYALNNRDEHIERVKIRLSDINGPRGGEDKCCHIQVIIPKLSDVIIEDTEANLYVAIDRAMDRASRAVNKKVTRQRNYRRVPNLSRKAAQIESKKNRMN